MKTVIKTVYVSTRGREYETPKGALKDDFESFAYNTFKEFCGEDTAPRAVEHVIEFLRAAAAHPARCARRLRRLGKIRQSIIDYEQAEAKQPDALPF